MSRKLPKATAETLDDIRRDAPPAPEPPAAGPVAPEPAREVPAAFPGEGESVALRRARAGEIVERHTAYAAVGGLLPLPLLDTLSVMATVALMIQAVAELYGQPVRRERARVLAASLAGGIGQAGAGSATASALAKWVPGANAVGMVVSSVAAAALTRSIGRAFILHFETGGTALQFDAEALRAYFAASSRSQPISRQ
jgi:uncharacterized protein (DUF697 family)